MGLRCLQPPHYLPPVKEAWAEGPAEAGKPGEKVRMRVGIPDRWETEGGEGYFHVDQGECRMVWEQRRAEDYSGRLSVSDCAMPRDAIVPQAPLWVSARLALTEHISPAFREAPVLTESLYSAFLDARRCSSR
jgi:hypothetical protein